MLNAKELVERFEETKAKTSNKISVRIDDDINLLKWKRNASSTLNLEVMPSTTRICSLAWGNKVQLEWRK